MLHLLLYLLLFVCLAAGLLVLFVNLPGLWVMVLAAAIFSVLFRPAFTHPTLAVLLLLLGLAAFAEVMDFFAAGAGAKRAGATRRGLWGAIIGSVVGAIAGTFILPWFMTLVGVCVGTFLGAWIGEVSGGQEIGKSVRIAVYATIGRLAGTVGKLIIGSIMLLITMFCAWPWRQVVVVTPPAVIRSVSPPPATMPTTTQPV
jgi:hypothetical protein